MALPVENSVAIEDSDPEIDPRFNVKLRADHLQEMVARRKKEEEEQAEERRAGRPLGKLTQSLKDKLRACNVAQLKAAKKLCDDYIEDHRKPPPRDKCGQPFTVKVLKSVTVKNYRYQLEFQRTTRRAKQVYLYLKVCKYWRDGAIVHPRTIAQDKYLRQKLPKKVWAAFKDHLKSPETEALLQRLLENERSVHANSQA
jgi:hypothetical protein